MSIYNAVLCTIFLGYSTLSLVLLSSLVVSIFNTAVFAADCMSKYFYGSGSNVCHTVTSITLVCHSVVCVSSLTSSLVSLCHKASFNWCSGCGVSWTISLSCFELEYLFLNGMEVCFQSLVETGCHVVGANDDEDVKTLTGAAVPQWWAAAYNWRHKSTKKCQKHRHQGRCVSVLVVSHHSLCFRLFPLFVSLVCLPLFTSLFVQILLSHIDWGSL